jgi:hypothetical protein
MSGERAIQCLLFDRIFPIRPAENEDTRFPGPVPPSPRLDLDEASADSDSLEYPVCSSHRETLDRVCETYRERLNGFRLNATYYKYKGLTHTIRARNDDLFIRISHHFKSQPDRVIEAVGHILVRKLLRMRPLRREVHVCRHAEENLQQRGVASETPAGHGDSTRYFKPPKGAVYDLEMLADRLSGQFFDGDFPDVALFWSAKKVRRYWGKYYQDPPRIVINSRLDHPTVPRFVVEAVLYHEMLHHHLGIRLVEGRRRMHTRAFRQAERRYPLHAEAETFLADFQNRRRGRKKPPIAFGVLAQDQT